MTPEDEEVAQGAATRNALATFSKPVCKLQADGLIAGQACEQTDWQS